MKTILAAIDFSPVSRRVIAEATDLARKFQGRVVLLHVVQPPSVIAEYGALLGDVIEMNQEAERAVSRHLKELKAELQASFIETETRHAVGQPGRTILDYAQKEGADYVVMGSHGHSPFYDLIVGSTASWVLRNSTCPVVIVPALRAAKTKQGKSASTRSGRQRDVGVPILS